MSSTTTTTGASAPGASFQLVVVGGVVHAAPVCTTTQDGSALTSFDLLVTDEAGRSLVPITVRDQSCTVVEGAAVVVQGRVVKRFHRAGGATVARTSVEATCVLDAPRPAALRRLGERALVAAVGQRPADRRRSR